MSSSERASTDGSPLSPDYNPPTIAPFSSTQANRRRSAVVVEQKSPLLIATPPQITRALAFSHPFILSLNQLLGLISWTSEDPWESYLLVAIFWAVVLYGSNILRWAGPIMLVAGLILGMYSRRYSPLSSTGLTAEKTRGWKAKEPEPNMKHQKSLDEILDTLNVFTSRCNVLLDPFVYLTDFLSTQRTATTASTRPALTTLFLRILMITPIWTVLALPPIEVITTKRIVLTIGTMLLSWHSRPARVARTLLWRSLTIRHVISIITGLDFITQTSTHQAPSPPLPPRSKSQHDIATTIATDKTTHPAGVRFTFVVYENQRRWLGLGWTSSLFAYERAPWTDEHTNPSASKDEFQLPIVENGNAKWEWVSGREWRIEGVGKQAASKTSSDGWIYYDNKWNDGRRGQDGWGRYTRRRKWYRDAELVEVAPRTNKDPADTVSSSTTMDLPHPFVSQSEPSPRIKDTDDTTSSQARRRGFLRRGSRGSSNVSGNLFSDEDETDRKTPIPPDREMDWDIGDDLKMGLG
ncbi:MAG: peroxisome- protein [Icmadophila ericetorum]|nr:peroxisome- protein [Icmadophila ericetorum]